MKVIDRIKEEVSIYDLFDIANPPVRYPTRAKPSQISCPFHGDDTHPSARVYPDDNFFRCYFCSKSWDVVSYWAQANEWYRSDDKLDIGRAIEDLCSRYGISNTFSDWEKRFYSLKKQHEDSEAAGIDSEERLRLASFYSWDISKLVHAIPTDQRVELRSVVLTTWDDFSKLDLNMEDWKDHLISWYRSAKLELYEKRL